MKKLKLNNLADAKLNEKELKSVMGGADTSGTTTTCGCGCAYLNSGGSGTMDNGSANRAKGWNSKENVVIWTGNSWTFIY